jgi:peptidoglycan/LPS O-acetylase OafA/YrhL
MVVFWHYIPGSVASSPGSPLAYAMRPFFLTWSGVNLFFVLSGFLIGGILIDNKGAENYFIVFYTRRICRIFPLYYFWVLLFVVLSVTTASLFPYLLSDPLPIWSYLTYTQNFVLGPRQNIGAGWMAVTWSLAVEEQFYLLLPLLVKLTQLPRLPRIFVASVPLALVFRVVAFHFGLRFDVYLPAHIDDFSLGALGAYLARYSPEAITSGKLYFTLACSGFLLVILTYNPSQLNIATFGYLALAVFYSSFLLLAVVHKSSFISRLSTIKWLRQLGIMAYGVYLFHVGVMGLTFGLLGYTKPVVKNLTDLALAFLAFAVTVVAAYFSWHYFERPIVSLGQSLKYKRSVESGITHAALPERSCQVL